MAVGEEGREVFEEAEDVLKLSYNNIQHGLCYNFGDDVWGCIFVDNLN